jgi:iron complex outermembrane receptor protein
MDNKNRPFSDTVVAISKIHARNMGGKFGVNFNLGKAKVETGADYENIYKDGKRYKNLITQPNLPVKTEDLWKNAHISNIGLFLEYSRSFRKIDVVAALRFDMNSAGSDSLLSLAMNGDIVYQNNNTKSNYKNLSASAGITWHLSAYSHLTASLGRGTRSPNMTERFIILLPVGFDNYDYLGNPDLKPESNNELDLGYRFNHHKFGQIEISGFYSYVTNYISTEFVPPSEVKPQTKGVLGVKRFINIDQAMLSGFEFTWTTPEKYLWSVGLSAAYTIGWDPEAIKYIYEEGQVVDEETIKDDPLPEIPPLETNLKLGYRFFKKKLNTTFRVRFAAAQNRISVSYGEKTTPSFITLGFDINYKFNKSLTIFAGVNNILNTAYYEHLNRRIVGTNQPLYEVGRVFYANLIFKL